MNNKILPITNYLKYHNLKENKKLIKNILEGKDISILYVKKKAYYKSPIQNYIEKYNIKINNINELISNNIYSDIKCINKMIKLMDYKYLFNKINLNLVPYDLKIYYTIIKNLKSDYNKNLFCHIHCYDLINFYEYFSNVIKKLKNKFVIIITYVNKSKVNLQDDDFILINCKNKGYDIGPKFIATLHIKKNYPDYKYILYLHSKNNKKKRLEYFNPLINNLNKIIPILKKESVYGIFPYILHKKKEFNINKLYYDDFCNLLNIKKKQYDFIEGNVCILHREITDRCFTNINIYNCLNDDFSFDYNWVNIYYKNNIYNPKIHNYDINEIYDFYKNNNNVCGNNIELRLRYKNNWSDGMIEHVFERLYLTIIKSLNKKYILINKRNKFIKFD